MDNDNVQLAKKFVTKFSKKRWLTTHEYFHICKCLVAIDYSLYETWMEACKLNRGKGIYCLQQYEKIWKEYQTQHAKLPIIYRQKSGSCIGLLKKWATTDQHDLL